MIITLIPPCTTKEQFANSLDPDETSCPESSVWHSDNISDNFGWHWSTLKIEADKEFSRRNIIWRARGWLSHNILSMQRVSANRGCSILNWINRKNCTSAPKVSARYKLKCMQRYMIPQFSETQHERAILIPNEPFPLAIQDALTL